MATLADLDTVLGVEDLYDLLEVAAVSSHNRRIADEHRRREADRR